MNSLLCVLVLLCMCVCVSLSSIQSSSAQAASPIRFAPTVALTPVVAKLIGKKDEDENKDANDAEEAD